LTQAEIVLAIESENPKRIADALYSATRHDPDWRWVQEQLLRLISHQHSTVRWASATCLGDLAMFHRTLDRERVLAALEKASLDLEIRAPSEFSISLVKQFVDPQDRSKA
jgi:hypothetical protein